MTSAVAFDLFETLVDYDEQMSVAFSRSAAALLGRDDQEFHLLWREGRRVRDSGPLASYLSSIGIHGSEAEELTRLRREWMLNRLVHPRPGAVPTLRELRRRGMKTGLITVCSQDVEDVWSETPFAGLFDAEVFSCAAGLHKPDPRIYRLLCDRLGVDPAGVMYLGDGANDELAGAEQVGMRAVLIHRSGQDPPWPEVRNWPGPRITALPELLELV